MLESSGIPKQVVDYINDLEKRIEKLEKPVRLSVKKEKVQNETVS